MSNSPVDRVSASDEPRYIREKREQLNKLTRTQLTNVCMEREARIEDLRIERDQMRTKITALHEEHREEVRKLNAEYRQISEELTTMRGAFVEYLMAVSSSANEERIAILQQRISGQYALSPRRSLIEDLAKPGR